MRGGLLAEKENTRDILPPDSSESDTESGYLEVGERIGEIEVGYERGGKGSNRLQRMLREEGVQDHYTPAKPTRFASEANAPYDSHSSDYSDSDRSVEGREADEFDRAVGALSDRKGASKPRSKKEEKTRRPSRTREDESSSRSDRSDRHADDRRGGDSRGDDRRGDSRRSGDRRSGDRRGDDRHGDSQRSDDKRSGDRHRKEDRRREDRRGGDRSGGDRRGSDAPREDRHREERHASRDDRLREHEADRSRSADQHDSGDDRQSGASATRGDDRQPSAAALEKTGAPAATTKNLSRALAADSSDDPLFFNDLTEFVSNPAPEGVTVKCEIVRDKAGVEKGMYPMYYLKLEPRQGETKKVFLLAGRKRKRSKSSNYIISVDATDLSRNGESFVAKLRSNWKGTNFTIYDHGVNPDKASKAVNKDKPIRCELASVLYETNILGFKGPRKMTVLMPGMDPQQKAYQVQPKVDRDTIVKRHNAGRMTDLISLKNKQPAWNEETLSYVLNFKGRVTQASVKNFQIIHEEDPEYVVLQFGRVNENVFTMDYNYPMTAIQAFGICLSSFDGKLACE